MWKKNRQESGGMEGALVVLLLACIIIKSGLLAFCLYAARRGRHFCDEKKGGTENFPEKKHSRMFPGKRVGWKTMPLLLQWFLFGGHVSSARVVGFGDPPCLFLEGTDRFVKKDTAKGCQSSV